MVGTCSICLQCSSDPVSIPCGHIYCAECLSECVNTEEDDFTAKCPTCRAEFTTVNPDLSLLPKKYHQYVLPSIRRLFIDMTEFEAMQRKTKDLEKKVRALEKDREQLMRQCERHIAASHAHASGEAKARQALSNIGIEAKKLREEKDAAITEGATLRQKYERIKQELKETQSNRQPDASQAPVSTPFRVSSNTSPRLKRKIPVDLPPRSSSISAHLASSSSASSSPDHFSLFDESPPPAKRPRIPLRRQRALSSDGDLTGLASAMSSSGPSNTPLRSSTLASTGLPCSSSDFDLRSRVFRTLPRPHGTHAEAMTPGSSSRSSAASAISNNTRSRRSR
ncbi:hypothetical protein HGRIS_005085 [Hohenbuehelia grisea]|uniref:RING-type domain-containing protein n=1 Tax=Hohenbuehelia grisea TaxID=104357 RepID=A0ABR3JE57_9AGAR